MHLLIKLDDESRYYQYVEDEYNYFDIGIDIALLPFDDLCKVS